MQNGYWAYRNPTGRTSQWTMAATVRFRLPVWYITTTYAALGTQVEGPFTEAPTSFLGGLATPQWTFQKGLYALPMLTFSGPDLQPIMVKPGAHWARFRTSYYKLSSGVYQLHDSLTGSGASFALSYGAGPQYGGTSQGPASDQNYQGSGPGPYIGPSGSAQPVQSAAAFGVWVTGHASASDGLDGLAGATVPQWAPAAAVTQVSRQTAKTVSVHRPAYLLHNNLPVYDNNTGSWQTTSTTYFGTQTLELAIVEITAPIQVAVSLAEYLKGPAYNPYSSDQDTYTYLDAMTAYQTQVGSVQMGTQLTPLSVDEWGWHGGTSFEDVLFDDRRFAPGWEPRLTVQGCVAVNGGAATAKFSGGPTLTDWAQGTGYVPDPFVEVSGWRLSRNFGVPRSAPPDFDSFAPVSMVGGTVTSAFNGGGYGTDLRIAGTVSSSAVRWAATASPVQTPAADPATGVSPWPANTFASATLLPRCESRASLDERWFDGAPYSREGGDTMGTAIQAQVAAYNASLAALGSRIDLPRPSAWPTSTEYFWGRSGYTRVDWPLRVSPVDSEQFGSFAGVVGAIALCSPAWPNTPPEMHSDVFQSGHWIGTGNLPWIELDAATPQPDAVYGRLTLQRTLPALPAVSLSVTSAAGDAHGASADRTGSLGNWGAQRYLVVTLDPASAAGARLTVTTSDGRAATYELPNDGSGRCLVDLACPVDASSAAFGVGVGLWDFVPGYTVTYQQGHTWANDYGTIAGTRPPGDAATQSAAAAVTKLTLSVPGPSQSAAISGLTFVDDLGADHWLDPRRGDLVVTEIQQGYIDPPRYVGGLRLLVDGKQALRYPYWGWLHVDRMTGVNYDYQPVDLYNQHLSVQDLIDDLGGLAVGFSASWVPAFTPVYPTAIPDGVEAIGPAATVPLWLLTDPHGAYGRAAYTSWAHGAQSFAAAPTRRWVRYGLYNWPYLMTVRWVHGGGFEGLAFDNDAAPLALDLTANDAASVPPYPTSRTVTPQDDLGILRSLPYGKDDTVTLTHAGGAYKPLSQPVAGHLDTVTAGRADRLIPERGYLDITANLIAAAQEIDIAQQIATGRILLIWSDAATGALAYALYAGWQGLAGAPEATGLCSNDGGAGTRPGECPSLWVDSETGVVTVLYRRPSDGRIVWATSGDDLQTLGSETLVSKTLVSSFTRAGGYPFIMRDPATGLSLYFAAFPNADGTQDVLLAREDAAGPVAFEDGATVRTIVAATPAAGRPVVLANRWSGPQSLILAHGDRRFSSDDLGNTWEETT